MPSLLPAHPDDRRIDAGHYFIRGLEITLQHAVQLEKPATLMEAYEAAWKAHLGPAPPWKAYIEKTRHEGM